ncbi:Phosphate import ATP-binding protein PstB 3 [bioreactor metagenome]|uniref:Phosphate import ATP-binding protein PstB 3 n=1 Tax=bioreactor metagenome TaxID=1076179 RepID=A0A644ZII9_9ZZZZ
MSQPKISVKNLNFYYSGKQVIEDVSLEIQAGEIYGLFGPANSGTTTLLRAINRMCDLVPGARAEGEILLDGKNIRAADFNVTELRRRVGIVFEEPVPLPMSIFENIAYGPRMSGMKDKTALEEKVESALKMAVLWDEVKDILRSSALRLSGGQQQRLCIARTLALGPEVIMLDRPCAALDPISTYKIEESLQQLKEHYTILIVPHNIQQLSRVSDRAGFMLMGSLVEQGPTDELFTNPKDQRTGDYISGRFG